MARTLNRKGVHAITLDPLDTTDPISDTIAAVDHIEALLDSVHAVTHEEATLYGTDHM